MEEIISPVSKELILAELTPDKIIRKTNKGGNIIYSVTWQNSPNIVREIGRLREITFREAGGCSGLSMDIDEFDTMEQPYHQLFVWDPDAEAIIGGYRYILGNEIQLRPDGQPNLATSHMFSFSEAFIRDYLPHTIELGRSFVTPEYQSSKAGAKALFALDNLWDGLATLMILHPQNMYFFGKMTMYPSYDKIGHDLILHYYWKHFGDKDELVRPIKPVMPEAPDRLMDLILKDDDPKSDYRNLKDAIHRLGTSIPPLINSYMNTSRFLKMFGTAVNDEFGDVEETGILVGFDEMYPDKKARHIESFFKQKLEGVKKRFPRLEEGFEEKVKARWEDRRGIFRERFVKKIIKSKTSITNEEFAGNQFFAEALEYIRNNDLASMECGSYEIDGRNLFVNIVEKDLKDLSEARLEVHDKYIDIQVPLSGEESFGVQLRDRCKEAEGLMDAEGDILFFNDKITRTLTLKAGEMLAFGPDIAHAPLIGSGTIKKAIFKVRV